MLNIKLCNYTQYNLKSHGHGEYGERDEAAVTNQDVYVQNSGATGEEGEGRESGSVSYHKQIGKVEAKPSRET